MHLKRIECDQGMRIQHCFALEVNSSLRSYTLLVPELSLPLSMCQPLSVLLERNQCNSTDTSSITTLDAAQHPYYITYTTSTKMRYLT